MEAENGAHEEQPSTQHTPYIRWSAPEPCILCRGSPSRLAGAIGIRPASSLGPHLSLSTGAAHLCSSVPNTPAARAPQVSNVGNSTGAG